MNLKTVDPVRLCDAYIESMTNLDDLIELLEETVTEHKDG